jgi:hypothetical protein
VLDQGEVEVALRRLPDGPVQEGADRGDAEHRHQPLSERDRSLLVKGSSMRRLHRSCPPPIAVRRARVCCGAAMDVTPCRRSCVAAPCKRRRATPMNPASMANSAPQLLESRPPTTPSEQQLPFSGGERAELPGRGMAGETDELPVAISTPGACDLLDSVRSGHLSLAGLQQCRVGAGTVCAVCPLEIRIFVL